MVDRTQLVMVTTWQCDRIGNRLPWILATTTMTIDLDPTTQANYAQIASTHVDLEWSIDFETKRVRGCATHTFEVRADGVQEVMCVGSCALVALSLLNDR